MFSDVHQIPFQAGQVFPKHLASQGASRRVVGNLQEKLDALCRTRVSLAVDIVCF